MHLISSTTGDVMEICEDADIFVYLCKSSIFFLPPFSYCTLRIPPNLLVSAPPRACSRDRKAWRVLPSTWPGKSSRRLWRGKERYVEIYVGIYASISVYMQVCTFFIYAHLPLSPSIYLFLPLPASICLPLRPLPCPILLPVVDVLRDGPAGHGGGDFCSHRTVRQRAGTARVQMTAGRPLSCPTRRNRRKASTR